MVGWGEEWGVCVCDDTLGVSGVGWMVTSGCYMVVVM